MLSQSQTEDHILASRKWKEELKQIFVNARAHTHARAHTNYNTISKATSNLFTIEMNAKQAVTQ